MIDYIGLRVLAARNQHLIYVNALAFLNIECHIHAIVAGRFRRRLERGIRKSAIEVIIENDVAIVRDARVRKRLPRTGIQRRQRIRGLSGISADLETPDYRLRAFVYANHNRHFILDAAVIVLDLSIDFHLGEPVRAI